MTAWGALPSSLSPSLSRGITRWAKAQGTCECTCGLARVRARLPSHSQVGHVSSLPARADPRNSASERMAGLGLAGLSASACRPNASASLAPCGACVQTSLWERASASERPIPGAQLGHCSPPAREGSTNFFRNEATAGVACAWQASPPARGPCLGMKQPWRPAGQSQLLLRGLWLTDTCARQGPVHSSLAGRPLPRAHASLAQREDPLAGTLGAALQSAQGGAASGAGGRVEQTSARSHFFADPRVTWQSLGVSEAVEEALCRGGFARPSAVQAVAVPHILSGQDAVLAAETGSGKTHTYLAAIAERALSGFLAGAPGESRPREEGPPGGAFGRSGAQGVPGVGEGQREAVGEAQGLVRRSEEIVRGERRHRGHRFALILCPNATLCRQVMEMALHLRDSTNRPLLSVEAVVGGEGWPSEPPQVVVATPAALMNQLFAADPRRMRRAAFIRDLAMLVVDEADMLLSGGYARQVTRLLGLLRLEERAQAEAHALEAKELLPQHPSADGGRSPPSAFRMGFTEADNEEGPSAPRLDEAARPWTDFLPPQEEDGGGEQAPGGQELEGSMGAHEPGPVTGSPLSGEPGSEEDGADTGYEVAEEEWEEGMEAGAGAGAGREGDAAGSGWIQSPGTVVHRKGAALLEGLGRRALKRRGFARSKQYVFVAATMPESGKRTVGQVLQWQFPEATWISGRHLHRRVPSAKAEWLAVDEDTRAQVLLGLLEAALGASAPGTGAPSPHAARTAGHTLVFANSVDSVDAIGRLLTARGVPCSVFHKDVPAQERALTILRFQGAGPKAGAAAGAGAGTGAGARSTEAGTPAGEDGGVGSEWGVLVCTDAASRGVDIPNVAHVIQAEFALSAVDFLHRIGRTARAGQSGRVTSLYSRANEDLVQAVRSALEAGAPVDSAFSRKRSFKKKLKKFRRAA